MNSKVGALGVAGVSFAATCVVGVLMAWTGAAAQAMAGPAGNAMPAGYEHMAQDTLGKSVFTSKGLCYVCHGPDAKGTPLAPDLTDTIWLNIDGSQDSIAALIRRGVPSPKEHPSPMPPMGGAQLTDAEISAVAAYVFGLRNQGG